MRLTPRAVSEEGCARTLVQQLHAGEEQQTDQTAADEARETTRGLPTVTMGEHMSHDNLQQYDTEVEGEAYADC